MSMKQTVTPFYNTTSLKRLADTPFRVDATFMTLLLLTACGGGGGGGSGPVVSGRPRDVPDSQLFKIVEISSENNPITGDASDEYYLGGRGDDYVNAQSGDDILVGRGGNDIFQGGVGSDLLGGRDGNDELYGNSGDDFLLGGNGNDSLYGHGDNDVLFGGYGDDTLKGGEGDDALYAGRGEDNLYGDEGNDILAYNNTNSTATLNGGTGSDYFTVFATVDDTDTLVTIKDYNPEEDAFLISSVFIFSRIGDDGNTYFKFEGDESGKDVLIFEGHKGIDLQLRETEKRNGKA